MALQSGIEWTEATWNPVTGCSKVSPGCAHCYAERMSKRLKAMGQENYRNGFELTLHEHALGLPLAWKRPQMIFVNSMSDLFHGNVPLSFIKKVFEVMKRADWHVFQVLTKRSGRLAQIAASLSWPENVWMGVSVENGDYVRRIDDLRKVPSAVRFVSFEPLLGPVGEVNLERIDWAIVGGESGPKARPMRREWVLEIKDRCKAGGVPFFFKQWGGVNKKKAGGVLDGKIYDGMPSEAAHVKPLEKQTKLVFG